MAESSDLQRREAVSGQLRALAEVGEHVLANRTARGLYLYDSDPVVRETLLTHEGEVISDAVRGLLGLAGPAAFLAAGRSA